MLTGAKGQPNGIDVAAKAINHHKQRGDDGTGSNQSYQTGNQALIAASADHAAEPEASGDHHRHGHPDNATLGLDPDFIGLDLPKLAWLHDLLVVESFRLQASSFHPVADGVRLEAKGVFDGDERTAPGDESDDHDDECLVSSAAMEDGAGAGAEGLPTDVAAVASLFLAVYTDIALAELASCRTVQVGAPYDLRIHGVLLLVRHPGLSMDPLIC
jgi:hypothetical protein